MKDIMCRFCGLAGTRRMAVKIMPQTEAVKNHLGRTHFFWRWLPVCEEHAARWYGDGSPSSSPPGFVLDEPVAPAPAPASVTQLCPKCGGTVADHETHPCV